MTNLLLTLLMLAFPVYAVTSMVLSYRAAEGTTWERLLAAFRNSASLFWVRLNAIGLGIGTLIGDVGSWLDAPGVKDVVAPYLKPQYMVAYMLVVLVGAEIARRRTLAK